MYIGEAAYLLWWGTKCVSYIQTLPAWAVVIFRQVQCKTNFVQVGSEYTYDRLHMYNIEGGPVEQQGPTHWNPIGRSMTAQRRVLSPSNSLPLPSCHCAFIVTSKNLPWVSKILMFKFFILFYLFIYFSFCVCQWLFAVTRLWKLSAFVSETASSLFQLILHMARDTVLNMRVSQIINFHAYSSGTEGLG